MLRLTVESKKKQHNKRLGKRREYVITNCVRCRLVRPIISLGFCASCKSRYNKLLRRSKAPKRKCGYEKCNIMLPEPIRYCVGHNTPMLGKKHSKETIDKMKKANRPNTSCYISKAENILFEQLKKLNTIIITQRFFTIRDFKHPVDFFIPPNTIIEVDGERWHGMLINKENNTLIPQRDFIISAELESKGYEVLRFWNKDIFENIQWVMNIITNKIGKLNIVINDKILCQCNCGKYMNKYDKRGNIRRYLPYHRANRTDKGKRKCSECGSSKTRLLKTVKGTLYERWRKDGKGGYWCGRCEQRLKRIMKRLAIGC